MSYKEKPLRANYHAAMEAEACQVYLSLHSKSPLSVKECGMFVDAELGFLGASPDGIVRDEAATDTMVFGKSSAQWKLCQLRL